MLDTEEKGNSVQSIYRAANILDCICKGMNSITEIADYSNLSKSTVHRLLKALGESRMIVQDPINRQYYLGGLITRLLSRPDITHESLIRCADPEMKHLSRITEETVYLGMMTALNYIGLYDIPSKHSLMVAQPYEGKSGPAYAGAGGKILLSQLDNKALKLVLKNTVLEPFTDYTVTDKDELMAQIKRIRQQGYAISYNEILLGVTCIAAPIKNYGIPVVLNIVGPTERIRPRIKEFPQLLLASVERISRNIEEYNS